MWQLGREIAGHYSPPSRRPSWECASLAWAREHAPRLAAWVLELEERARLAWEPWAEEEAWAEWELARRELRRAWEEATGRAPGNAPEQPPEEPPAAGNEAGERELSFAEAEALFGGFDAVWELTDAQAGALEKLFAAKGPVLVRAEAGWFGAEEWKERVARVDGAAALQCGGVPGRLVAGALRERRCRNGGKGRVAKTDYS
ncbi:hypothetical protein [Desulfovirgula thermocuniculi]|uniref:hypothetical protein n=1 Tax=Desulfovirgula thermocuniculi TaxID=348842 RepID=UPI0004274B81|nr:hypothetical protein [Desulfovirgula thermocuniculi]